MFPKDLTEQASILLQSCRNAGVKLATAESCTGGLVASCLTEISGSSDVFDRGFITYSNEAKNIMLDVPMCLIQRYGAVSEPVARAMAEGAITHSLAVLSIAVTGVAGPGGGTDEKPVGLVHVASAKRGKKTRHRAEHYGDLGRSGIREATVRTAIKMLMAQIT